jgi:hypothetical protein
MNCPKCESDLIKKNGHTRHGKQNFRCLECGKQFSENAQSNLIPEHTKTLIGKSLLERISLNGICRVFDVSMPWLLDYIDILISQLPEDLNAEVTCSEDDDLELIKLEADELWSFVGSKKNDQWLWLVLHKSSRQILAMQVGPRNKKTADLLFAKLPESLKKKPSILQINLASIMTRFPGNSINRLEKNLVRRVTLKDLTARLDNDVQDLSEKLYHSQRN